MYTTEEALKNAEKLGEATQEFGWSVEEMFKNDNGSKSREESHESSTFVRIKADEREFDA